MNGYFLNLSQPKLMPLEVAEKARDRERLRKKRKKKKQSSLVETDFNFSTLRDNNRRIVFPTESETLGCKTEEN